MPEINGVSLPFLPIGGNNALKRHSDRELQVKDSQKDFASLFNDELNKVKFSGHAQNRINSRDIGLNTDELKRLNSAVDKAEAKGANESLVVLGEKAFIVNVPNKTVITVLNKELMESNVVTNIDSAVFG